MQDILLFSNSHLPLVLNPIQIIANIQPTLAYIQL